MLSSPRESSGVVWTFSRMRWTSSVGSAMSAGVNTQTVDVGDLGLIKAPTIRAIREQAQISHRPGAALDQAIMTVVHPGDFVLLRIPRGDVKQIKVEKNGYVCASLHYASLLTESFAVSP